MACFFRQPAKLYHNISAMRSLVAFFVALTALNVCVESRIRTSSGLAFVPRGGSTGACVHELEETDITSPREDVQRDCVMAFFSLFYILLSLSLL